MDQLKELLFERPATIYIVLGAVEVLVLAVWAWRRTSRCGWAALAAPVLAVVVGLIAHYVQSDAEKIAAILDGAIANIEAGKVDAAAECLDSKFAVPDSRGRPIPKGRYVEMARRTLRRWPVERKSSGMSASPRIRPTPMCRWRTLWWTAAAFSG